MMSEWLSRRLAEQRIIKEEEQGLYQYGISTGHPAECIYSPDDWTFVGTSCDGNRVHLIFYDAAKLQRRLSFGQQAVLLCHIQCSPADTGLYITAYEKHSTHGSDLDSVSGIVHHMAA